MASTTPAKKATKKATAPARTRAGATRTAAAPAVVVEEEAVQAAAARKPRPRPAADRPAAKAAAALRQAGEAEPTPAEPEAPGLVVADDDGEDVELRTTVVPFKGRSIEVMLPTQEQLTMYHRLSREFQGLARTNTDDMSMDEALRQLDRATRLVQSVMKDQLDRDWLEDQLLEGKVTLGECTDLLKAAFQELHKVNEEQQNRAARRNASKARLADA